MTEKSTDFQLADFCEKLLYPECFHYRNTNQVQKKFQDENSVTEK